MEIIDLTIGKEEAMLFKSTTELAREAGIELSTAKDLMADYVKSLPEFIRELETAVLQSDFERLKRMLHQLKGSSQNFRLHEVEPCVLSLEASVEERDWHTCLVLAKELLQMAETLVLIIKEE